MQQHPDYPNFARRVEEIDNRLRKILSNEVLNPNETEWWTRRPLKILLANSKLTAWRSATFASAQAQCPQTNLSTAAS